MEANLFLKNLVFINAERAVYRAERKPRAVDRGQQGRAVVFCRFRAGQYRRHDRECRGARVGSALYLGFRADHRRLHYEPEFYGVAYAVGFTAYSARMGRILRQRQIPRTLHQHHLTAQGASVEGASFG